MTVKDYDLAKEVLMILPYIDKEYLIKIPQDFINNLVDLASLSNKDFTFEKGKNFKEMVKDSPEAGRGGFIPPSGDGYEYFVDSTRIVYVFQRAKNKFRIYLIQGDAPNVSMKHDKHGQYFTVRSESTATAEKIIDNTFHNRVAIP